MNALITGYAGFVGRHLWPRLDAAGYNLTGTDDFVGSITQGVLSGEYVKRRKNFDVIVHLGANIVNVDARSKMGLKAFDDIELDLAVCKWVEQYPPTKAFVVMSSCAVDYPQDPYCTVKRTLEAFALKLHEQGVPVVILRPFSGYGPDQSTDYPFPAILGRAMRREDPLTVWGGHQTRDWLYIDDLIDAIMCGIMQFPRGIPIEIGTGVGTRLRDLAMRIANEVGYEPKIESVDKTVSSHSRIAEPRMANSCGWEAKVGLLEGIKRCINENKPKD